MEVTVIGLPKEGVEQLCELATKYGASLKFKALEKKPRKPREDKAAASDAGKPPKTKAPKTV